MLRARSASRRPPITHYASLSTLLRHPLQRLADLLRARTELQRRCVALPRLRLLPLFLVDHAEVVVRAGEIGLVLFRFRGEVLLQCFFSAREILSAHRGDLSDAKLDQHR